MFLVLKRRRGAFLIAEIDQMLKAEGYRFLKVQPEEAGVYYRYENGTVEVILGLLDHSAFQMNAAVCASMKEHIRELFFLSHGRVPGITEEMPVYQVDILCLAITDQVEKYRVLCNEMRGIWLVEAGTRRLIIYENQPGDFYGLQKRLLNLLDQCGEQTSARAPKREKHALQIDWRGMTWVNTGLVAVNILVWIVMELFGNTEDSQYLLEHGAMYPLLVVSLHEWYRLFTCMFVHIGFPHLVNNMIVLFFTGDRLEREIGKVKYLLIYLLSGLGGSLLSMVYMLKTGDMAVSAGASGAIFGVIGALLYLVIRNKGRIGTLTTRGLVLMIALCLYYGFTATGVDNWCHIGGLVMGFLLAVLIYRGNPRKD